MAYSLSAAFVGARILLSNVVEVLEVLVSVVLRFVRALTGNADIIGLFLSELSEVYAKLA